MTVAIPNCLVKVQRKNGTVIIPENSIANLQKVSYDKIPPQFQGIAVDKRPSHRVRVDAPLDPVDPTQISREIPTQGDEVFVMEFRAAPWCLGWWEVVDVAYDTGQLASLILYVRKKIELPGKR